MFLNNSISNKRKYNFSYKDKIVKNIKNTKILKNENNIDEEEDDEPDSPFKIPGLIQKEHDKHIYLKDNHLYFLTEVIKESVDEIKKLMRQYWNKYDKITKTNSCIEFKCKPLYIHISSPGGCLYSGFHLYDFIMEYKKKIHVYTVIEGLVASAATFISVAGTKRFITPNAYVLIHQLSTFFGGNFQQIEDEFANSKKCMEKIIEIYKIHTKINKKKIPSILKHDLNWNSDEALQYGIVDEIKLIDVFNDND